MNTPPAVRPASLFEWLFLRRRLVFALLALVTLVTATGLARVTLDVSYASLVDPSLPDHAFYAETTKRFGSDYVVLVVVADEALFTTPKLTRLRDLRRALGNSPLVDHINSVFDVGHAQAKGDAVDTTPVMASVPQDAAGLAAAMARARANPFVDGTYLAADGQTAAIAVYLKATWEDGQLPRQAFDFVEQAMASYRGDFARLYQLGPPRTYVESRRLILGDVTLLTPISIALLIGTVAIAFRSFRATLIPLCTALVSIVWTFGCLGWLGLPVNQLTGALPVLLVGIGATEDCYLIAGYFRALSESGDRRQALALTSRRLLIASVLTGTTTAIGFGSNVIGAIPFIQYFALATAIGMMINLVITIVLVPLLLASLFPRPTAKIASIGQRSRRLGQLIERVTRPLVATPRRRKPVLAAVFVLTGLSLATIIGLTPSIDPIAMINRRAQVVQDIDFFQERMTGLNLFYAVVETASGSLLEPDRLVRLAALEAEAQGLFGSAVSIADYVTLTHRAFTGAEAASTPPTVEATEQYLLFHDLGELRHFLADERQQALILVRHPYFDSREINRRLALLTSRAETLFAGSGLSLQVTGQNILVNRSAESLVESQFISFVALLGVTALFLAVAFRSLAVGLVSLIPNMLPGAFVFAVIAILDLPFNPGTGVAAMVCFGIAVDDTIHMINAHMLRVTGETDMPLLEEQALAVTLTVTCVSLAFLAFAFSQFSVVWHFGLLGAIGLWCAWVTDVVVTPLLLDVAGRVAQRRAAVRAA